jgi:hypothetical protein
MSDPSRLHATAVHALVQAAVPAGVRVYFGKVHTPDAEIAYPYLVVWPAPANRVDDALHGWAGQLSTVTQLTAAGTTVDEVLAVLDRAATALQGVTPTITGRDCGPLRQIPGAGPPSPDVDPRVKTPAGRDIYFSYVLFEMHSTASV